ncbi:MAG TPA: nucleotide exchange factor GrpE [Cyanothece sp. UBA12306]|nr:nucleotide exchange factor GrpE [Cyanothece sp. UBA12306]
MTNEQEQLQTNLQTPEVNETVVKSAPETQAEPNEPPNSVKSDVSVVEPETVESEVSEPETQQEEFNPEQVIAALTQEVASLTEKLAEDNQQSEALKKRHISLVAEFDNFRKRTEKEKKDLEVQVKCRTIKELLSVVDNFERARNQIEPANEGEANIHKSYQGVYKSLVDSLKRLGVSPMRPEGEPFDPLYHEAMLREQTNEYPEGTVLEQLIRGYLLGDEVLRHAMVKVAAPKEEDNLPEAASSQEENNSSPN